MSTKRKRRRYRGRVLAGAPDPSNGCSTPTAVPGAARGPVKAGHGTRVCDPTTPVAHHGIERRRRRGPRRGDPLAVVDHGSSADYNTTAQRWALPRLGASGTVSLASLHGRPVVVNFFASWCTVCASELPVFTASTLASEFHQLYGLSVPA